MIKIISLSLLAVHVAAGAVLPPHEGHDDHSRNDNVVFVTVTDYTTVAPTPSNTTQLTKTVHITKTVEVSDRPTSKVTSSYDAKSAASTGGWLSYGGSAPAPSFPSSRQPEGSGGPAPFFPSSSSSQGLVGSATSGSPAPFFPSSSSSAQPPPGSLPFVPPSPSAPVSQTSTFSLGTSTFTPIRQSSTAVVVVPVYPTMTHASLLPRDENPNAHTEPHSWIIPRNAPENPNAYDRWIHARQADADADADYRSDFNPATATPQAESNDAELRKSYRPLEIHYNDPDPVLSYEAEPYLHYDGPQSVHPRAATPNPSSSSRQNQIFTPKASHAATPPLPSNPSSSPKRSGSRPGPKPSSTHKPALPTTPAPAPGKTVVISEDRRCPYPYPGIHCGGPVTMSVTETKKASEMAKEPKSTGWCPYPGQEC